jgi:hypothetical protein
VAGAQQVGGAKDIALGTGIQAFGFGPQIHKPIVR